MPSSPFVTVYNDQQHFTYLDANGAVQDAWYDPSGWHLQQINKANGPATPGEYVATDGPAARIFPLGSLFVSVYNNQQHFTYFDNNNAIQDAWYDTGSGWHLQQINNANSAPTVPGEYIATNGPGLPTLAIRPFVSVYNGQQHFAYIDDTGNVQDAWYDSGDGWHLQQINNPNGPAIPGEYIATKGPAAEGPLFISVYNGQQHFAYVDNNLNIHDAWYDSSNGWHLQQINNPNGPAIPGEYVATDGPAIAGASAVGGNLFVSVYTDQQHFTYIDNNNNIQDAWYG